MEIMAVRQKTWPFLKDPWGARTDNSSSLSITASSACWIPPNTSDRQRLSLESPDFGWIRRYTRSRTIKRTVKSTWIFCPAELKPEFGCQFWRFLRVIVYGDELIEIKCVRTINVPPELNFTSRSPSPSRPSQRNKHRQRLYARL